MTNLKKLNTSIDKFILNEKRIEKFINDDFGYTTDEGVYVPSLRELNRKIESGEIDTGSYPILKIYNNYAAAFADLGERISGSYSRILVDETRDNRDTIYVVVNGALQFIKFEDIPDAIDSGTY